MNPSSQICTDLYRLASERNGENLFSTLNGVPVFIIQRFEEADYVLRQNAQNYRKNMDWLRQILGASRFTEDGHAWEIRRALTQTYFNKFDRETVFRLANRYALQALDRLVSDSQTRATIDDDHLRKMTSSVLIDSFFGMNLNDTSIDLSLLAQLMELGAQYSFIPAGKTGHLYREQLLTLPALRKKILQTLSYFREEGTVRSSLLKDMLEAEKRTENRFVMEQELIAFIAAGSETSAATMGWICYLLAKYPDVQERLHQIAEKFWTLPQPGWEELSVLQPMAHFVSEALRLYPPTPIVSRFAIEADRLSGQIINPGQNIMISFIGVQHDRRFKTDPRALNIDDYENLKVSGHNMSFSVGPRVCGGKQFALVELVTFLSVFLYHVILELTDDTQPNFYWKSQMLQAGGHPVRVTWRK